MRVKRRDAEQWMSHRLLPDPLKERIRRHEQYKWQETRGVDEDSLIRNLPQKRHKAPSLSATAKKGQFCSVPMFEKMDDQLMDAMCDRLKPVLYTEHSYIVREGDPVDEMLRFLWRRASYTGLGSSNLPISTRTVEALEEVEAFALTADDLKFVASQFRRLHSKQLRHTFRFYSQQWRTWAACFIQAAWRRHCRKKLEDSLREEEDRLQNALTGAGGSSPSLGATIYASRFAANALRALRRNGARKARIPEKLPPLMLQKPSEPDFTAEDK
ncbi:cyclic nucleotide-gated ion channel 1 [Tanacetum coccineum]